MNISDHLKLLEVRLLDPTVRRNSSAVASHLTEDFIESSTKPQSLKTSKQT